MNTNLFVNYQSKFGLKLFSSVRIHEIIFNLDNNKKSFLSSKSAY